MIRISEKLWQSSEGVVRPQTELAAVNVEMKNETQHKSIKRFDDEHEDQSQGNNS